MGFFKKLFSNDEEHDVFSNSTGVGEEYYNVTTEEMLQEEGGSKMILLEPRAFSESQQIADYLRNRNTVVVNLKRLTSDQAKRVIDFLSGTIYALGGDIQKIGGGIFLCTPNNINVQGKITDDKEGKDIHDNADLNVEW